VLHSKWARGNARIWKIKRNGEGGEVEGDDAEKTKSFFCDRETRDRHMGMGAPLNRKYAKPLSMHSCKERLLLTEMSALQ
jgi:hypothetical protein